MKYYSYNLTYETKIVVLGEYFTKSKGFRQF